MNSKTIKVLKACAIISAELTEIIACACLCESVAK